MNANVPGHYGRDHTQSLVFRLSGNDNAQVNKKDVSDTVGRIYSILSVGTNMDQYDLDELTKNLSHLEGMALRVNSSYHDASSAAGSSIGSASLSVAERGAAKSDIPILNAVIKVVNKDVKRTMDENISRVNEVAEQNILMRGLAHLERLALGGQSDVHAAQEMKETAKGVRHNRLSSRRLESEVNSLIEKLPGGYSKKLAKEVADSLPEGSALGLKKGVRNLYFGMEGKPPIASNQDAFADNALAVIYLLERASDNSDEQQKTVVDTLLHQVKTDLLESVLSDKSLPPKFKFRIIRSLNWQPVPSRVALQMLKRDSRSHEVAKKSRQIQDSVEFRMDKLLAMLPSQNSRAQFYIHSLAGDLAKVEKREISEDLLLSLEQNFSEMSELLDDPDLSRGDKIVVHCLLRIASSEIIDKCSPLYFTARKEDGLIFAKEQLFDSVETYLEKGIPSNSRHAVTQTENLLPGNHLESRLEQHRARPGTYSRHLIRSLKEEPRGLGERRIETIKEATALLTHATGRKTVDTWDVEDIQGHLEVISHYMKGRHTGSENRVLLGALYESASLDVKISLEKDPNINSSFLSAKDDCLQSIESARGYRSFSRLERNIMQALLADEDAISGMQARQRDYLNIPGVDVRDYAASLGESGMDTVQLQGQLKKLYIELKNPPFTQKKLDRIKEQLEAMNTTLDEMHAEGLPEESRLALQTVKFVVAMEVGKEVLGDQANVKVKALHELLDHFTRQGGSKKIRTAAGAAKILANLGMKKPGHSEGVEETLAGMIFGTYYDHDSIKGVLEERKQLAYIENCEKEGARSDEIRKIQMEGDAKDYIKTLLQKAYVEPAVEDVVAPTVASYVSSLGVQSVMQVAPGSSMRDFVKDMISQYSRSLPPGIVGRIAIGSIASSSSKGIASPLLTRTEKNLQMALEPEVLAGIGSGVFLALQHGLGQMLEVESAEEFAIMLSEGKYTNPEDFKKGRISEMTTLLGRMCTQSKKEPKEKGKMKLSERINFGKQLKNRANMAKGKFISERVGDLIENNDSVRLATTGFIESYVDTYLDHRLIEAQLEGLPVDEKTKDRLVECVSLLALNTISGVIELMSEAVEDPKNVKQLPMLLSSQLLTEDLVKSFIALDQREGIIEKAVEERIGKSGLISEHGLVSKAMDLVRSDLRAEGPIKQYVDDAVSTVAMPMIRETVFPAMQHGLKPLVDDWRTWLTGR